MAAHRASRGRTRRARFARRARVCLGSGQSAHAWARPRERVGPVARSRRLPAAGRLVRKRRRAAGSESGRQRRLPLPRVYAHPADSPSRLGGTGRNAPGRRVRRFRSDRARVRPRDPLRRGHAVRPGQARHLGGAPAVHRGAARAGSPPRRGTATFDAVARALRARRLRGRPERRARSSQLATLQRELPRLARRPGPAALLRPGHGAARQHAQRHQPEQPRREARRSSSATAATSAAPTSSGTRSGTTSARSSRTRRTRPTASTATTRSRTRCAPGRRPSVAGGPFNGLYFDYGNDDYWDPPQGAPLGWWTLNLSRFICPDARCNRRGAAAARDLAADVSAGAPAPPRPAAPRTCRPAPRQAPVPRDRAAPCRARGRFVRAVTPRRDPG